jgi:hypothetical protein
LRDVQLLAGHRSIQTTQRYIDGDTDVQRKLVAMIWTAMAESGISLHDRGHSPAKTDAALTHARSLILRVCHVAGTAAFIDETGLGPDGTIETIRCSGMLW